MNCGSACLYDGHGLELLRMMSLPLANQMVHSWNRWPTNEMADDLEGNRPLSLCFAKVLTVMIS